MKIISLFLYLSVSHPAQVVLPFPRWEPKEKPVREDDVGPQVQHIYEVINKQTYINKVLKIPTDNIFITKIGKPKITLLRIIQHYSAKLKCFWKGFYMMFVFVKSIDLFCCERASLNGICPAAINFLIGCNVGQTLYRWFLLGAAFPLQCSPNANSSPKCLISIYLMFSNLWKFFHIGYNNWWTISNVFGINNSV